MAFINEIEKKTFSNLLQERLNEILEIQIFVEFQDQITEDNFKEFSLIESFSFPEELRYSKKELIEKFSNNLPVFVFIRDETKILASILGYEYEKDSSLFFLDTIIVTSQKKGIGRILLDSLEKWLKYRNLKGIILYTEEFNYKGENLIKFYLKNGFQKISELEGNITMQRLIH